MISFKKITMGLNGTFISLYICLVTFVMSETVLSENDIKSSDYGEPLFLTSYLKSGKIEKARYLSRVEELPYAPKVKSFSGFLTVNRKYGSNIFFWFFPALNEDKKAPIILWIQGGPGGTGLFGLFIEHGPYVIDSNMTAKLRPYHWAENFQVIYIDNPVGTGFSFTQNDRGYVTNQEEMANDVFEFLQQFFTLFPEYRKNDFYLIGESYGGKFAPSVAYKIHKEDKSSKFNFKGMAIGNGFCSPEDMLDYGDYFYQLGLVDRKQANFIRNVSNYIIQLIHKGKYYEALVELDKLVLDFNVLSRKSYFSNHTGYEFYYNLLHTKEPEDFKYYKDYINLPKFRKAVHVGNLTFQDGIEVQKHLLNDLMRSVKHEIVTIMDNYRVLFYNGQLDLVIPYPLTVNFLHKLKWKYAAEYKEAERQIWKLADTNDVAGYVHNVNNFYEILVRNGGHILPYDQPEVTLDLITRFLKRKPYA